MDSVVWVVTVYSDGEFCGLYDTLEHAVESITSIEDVTINWTREVGDCREMSVTVPYGRNKEYTASYFYNIFPETVNAKSPPPSEGQGRQA